jgi:uncharacterized protein YjdB
MRTGCTKVLRVCIAVAVLATAATGLVSCGEKSYLSEIQITPADTGMAIGTSLQLSGYGVLSNGVTFYESYLSWTSSNTDLATVDSTGLVTAGTTTGVITISAVAVTPTNPIMAVDATFQFTATATLTEYSNWATQDVTSYMTWTSLNDAIATVDTSGIVTAVSEGTTTIQATDGYSGSSGFTVLTVTGSALSSIAISAENDNTSISIGSTVQLTATGTNEDESTSDVTSHVTWSSADTNVATVDSAGLVAGVSSGTVTITASDPVTAIYATIDITVN